MRAEGSSIRSRTGTRQLCSVECAKKIPSEELPRSLPGDEWIRVQAPPRSELLLDDSHNVCLRCNYAIGEQVRLISYNVGGSVLPQPHSSLARNGSTQQGLPGSRYMPKPKVVEPSRRDKAHFDGGIRKQGATAGDIKTTITSKSIYISHKSPESRHFKYADESDTSGYEDIVENIQGDVLPLPDSDSTVSSGFNPLDAFSPRSIDDLVVTALIEDYKKNRGSIRKEDMDPAVSEAQTEVWECNRNGPECLMSMDADAANRPLFEGPISIEGRWLDVRAMSPSKYPAPGLLAVEEDTDSGTPVNFLVSLDPASGETNALASPQARLKSQTMPSYIALPSSTTSHSYFPSSSNITRPHMPFLGYIASVGVTATTAATDSPRDRKGRRETAAFGGKTILP